MLEQKISNYSCTFDDLIGKSPLFTEAIDIARIAAKSDANVLIQGETGTGKELFAQSIHNESHRRDKPFTPINCSAIPKDLVESILFGTSSGGFTGALNKTGLFEEADGGTLFLDEVNSLDYQVQAKLLRVLNNGSFRKVGSTKETVVDVRIFSTSNVDLYGLTEINSFRTDLFFRLSVLNINIPSLRKRNEDIIPLIGHFIKVFNQKMNKKIVGISDEAASILIRHDWKGNVRELSNLIEGAMVTGRSSSKIELDDISPYLIKSRTEKGPISQDDVEKFGLEKYLEIHESRIINQYLSNNSGNLSKTSRELGIPYRTLKRKIERFKAINESMK